MKVGIDIGGVLSKYPELMIEMIDSLLASGNQVYIVTDMHPIEEVRRTLEQNWIRCDLIQAICVADYAKHGEACKAIICRDNGIDVLIDDHPGYLVWPWPEPAPLRLRVEPDPRRPYWAPGWKCEGGEFGRRVFMESDHA